MRGKHVGTEATGHELIKLTSNTCFSFFAIFVLIITVIAFAYNPRDPWAESNPAISKLLTRTKSATFKDDNSFLVTGEDLPQNSFTAVPESIDSVRESGADTADCENLAVNCSDPRVLSAVEKFNFRAFRSIVFLGFQNSVSGKNQDECDVAWSFRNKKEKSWRRYRDFRRFKLEKGHNCTYRVLHAGDWHSGINAKRLRTKNVSILPKEHSPASDEEMVRDFKKGRYLYYSRGGDYCKGMNHYLWSLLCGLGESMYLNRTFVMDMKMCLAGSYSANGMDQEGKDFRLYFDLEHLKETVSIVEEGEFLRKWKRSNDIHKKKMSVRKIHDNKVTPMLLKRDKNMIIWRQFAVLEPENYWYRVCEGQAENYIQRPWHAMWKSKRLMNIATAISGRMDWDFDAVHVVRGKKARNKVSWPHLDADTSPDALLTKLRKMVLPWRNLYVATNEPFYNYFDKLRSHYKVHLLDDYAYLWGNESEWYDETMALNNFRPIDFDGYMQVAVDSEVFYRAKTRVETFYNLTNDCKNGVGTC